MIVRTLFLLAVGIVMVGCETTNEADPATANNEEAVSTIPWNRPENWEGQGALGGMGATMGTR
jgi:hypothetical protein